MSRDPETSAASSPRTSAPSRRTILTGAAWSVPVIAAASIAPIASASGVTALAFDKASYSGTACGTITGAYVTVTEGGVPTAGQSVTVTLSGGYTFSGGGTAATQVSGSEGRVNLPQINVPSSGGNAAVSALAPGASGTTALLATPVAPSKLVQITINPGIYPAMPSGVTPMDICGSATTNGSTGYTTVLGNDGYIYQSINTGSWTKLSTGGVTHIAPFPSGGALYTTGSTVEITSNPGVFPAFPSGITPTDICGSTTTNGSTGYTTVLGNDGYIYQSINTGSWTKLSTGGVTHIAPFPTGGALYTLSSAC